MVINGDIAELIIKSKEVLENYPVSLDTHNLHISESQNEVAIVYRPKGASGEGRGNLSLEPAVTVVFERNSREVKDIYYVR